MVQHHYLLCILSVSADRLSNLRLACFKRLRAAETCACQSLSLRGDYPIICMYVCMFNVLGTN